jgi:hypothetical protein
MLCCSGIDDDGAAVDAGAITRRDQTRTNVGPSFAAASPAAAEGQRDVDVVKACAQHRHASLVSSDDTRIAGFVPSRGSELQCVALGNHAIHVDRSTIFGGAELWVVDGIKDWTFLRGARHDHEC